MVLNEQASAKWKPILEHEDLPQIADSYRKGVTAVLLENQERMMREQAAQRNGSGLFLTEEPMGSGMSIDNTIPGNPVGGIDSTLGPATGSVQFVDPVLISLVRRTMPKLLAYDVCGVQPLTGPTGLIFAMRSHYGSPGQLPTADGSTAINSEAFFGEANTAFSTNSGGGNHTSADPVDGFFSTPTTATHGTGATTNFGEQMGRGGAAGAIPEMSFSIEKMSVTAQTRKLRGQYTLEMAQDLKATHGLNAESELSNILSNEILAEVNRQVIRTIYTVAKKGALNTTTPNEFDLLVDSNGRWSVEKFKGLMFQMEVEANQIARQTRRGKGNVIICSADVASAFQMAGVLDYSSNLKVSLKTDETDNLFAGVLNGQFRVYIDPYLPVNATKAMVVVGYKGTSPYDAGVFYCPYQPLQMLRAQDPNTFTPIIGFMSRDSMVANPFSAIDDATGRAVRHADDGLVAHTNVYYRKLKVTNLT